MKKILAFTSIRSDYDLLSNLFRLLDADKNIELRLLVAGAHLSKAYGNSVREIEDDGFRILLKLETLINSDSPQSRIKSASILLQNSIDIIKNYSPNLIFVTGDREDVIVGALIGVYLDIPVVHFFGGDQSFNGFVDNKIRHATSMLSKYHMVTLNEHKTRLISFGIESNNIFVIGNPALDRFINNKKMNLDSLSISLNTDLVFRDYCVVIFHPYEESEYSIEAQIDNLVDALKESRLKVFISYPNVDPGNERVISTITKLNDHPDFYIYKNLSRSEFISLYKNAKVIIGNSSSGILEAASVPIPVVNVGRRQSGRTCGKNVLHTSCSKSDILEAIRAAISSEFGDNIQTMKNIYGDGKSSSRAYKIIQNILDINTQE